MSRERRKSPTPRDAQSILLERYQEAYQDDHVWRSIIEDSERRILAGKPDLEVGLPFIFYMFGKPEVAVQFPLASLTTLEAFQKAQRARKGGHVLETVFFVDEEDDRIFATRGEQKPAAYDLPVSHIDTVEAPRRQTIAMVHTHPPLRDVLKPSVYIQDEDGREFGDLLAFSTMHNSRAQAIEEGKYLPVVVRPLSVIMQSDLEKGVEKMLFILESPEVAALDREQYIKYLKDNKHFIDNAGSEEDVVKALREMGYKASIIEITTDELYGDFPIVGAHLERLLDELGLRF